MLEIRSVGDCLLYCDQIVPYFFDSSVLHQTHVTLVNAEKENIEPLVFLKWKPYTMTSGA